MKARIFAVFAALFVVACGEDPVVVPDPLAGPLVGRWGGKHGGAVVEVGVAAPGTALLSGCIAVGYDPVSRPADRVIVRMRGTRAERAVTFAPESGQSSLWTFTGTRQAVDTITGSGSLDGAGTAAVTLVRTSAAPGC